MKQMESKSQSQYKILYRDNVIQFRIEQIADTILTKHSSMDDIVFIGILKGGFMLLSDLLKHYKRPQQVEVEFIYVKTYDEKTNTKLSKDKVEPYFVGIVDKDSFVNKHIYVIEDIIESGETINKILKFLTDYPALSVSVVTLAQRESSTFQVAHNILNVGDEDWLVGYGMDDNGKMRGYGGLLTKNKNMLWH